MSKSYKEILEGRHFSTVQIMRFFHYKHLPLNLASISESCCELAYEMVKGLPDGPELTAGLRKLLEAKDCFVRQALERDSK
jgi:hypothetical protein